MFVEMFLANIFFFEYLVNLHDLFCKKINSSMIVESLSSSYCIIRVKFVNFWDLSFVFEGGRYFFRRRWGKVWRRRRQWRRHQGHDFSRAIWHRYALLNFFKDHNLLSPYELEQFLLVFEKINLCTFTPNCGRNHAITYIDEAYIKTNL